MEKHWWATDGCRLFTGEFKREQLAGGGGGGRTEGVCAGRAGPGFVDLPVGRVAVAPG